MTSPFTFEFLKDQFGKYVELNPATQQARLVLDQNNVWTKLEQHGGVGQVAKVFNLSEADVWAWVDCHEIPELYLRYLMDPGERVSDVQLSSLGYEDPVSGECWPANWRLDFV